MSTLPSVAILLLLISDVYAICSKTNQTCSIDSEHCIAQTAKLIYPDPDTGFASYAVGKSTDYACNSEAYCKWSKSWDVDCISFYLPNKLFSAPIYDDVTKQCSVIKVPVTINETISCCQQDMNCESVFAGIDEETESIYSTTNCVSRPDMTSVVESIVDCYATEQFMKYIKCNQTDYVGKCPLFFFYNLQQYAKCACIELGYFDEKEGSTDSYKYFKELTEMIEGIFADFRGKKQENCPEWIFSCNAEGDAQLDVFEIICSLTIYDDTDIQQLKIDVDEGVKSLTNDQVEIFQNGTNIIRVLMYSELEAMDAIEWLFLNATETTPDEIDLCTMEETIWNLNDVYGDYIAPQTPAPTDNSLLFNLSFNLSFSFLIVLIIIFV